jgi:PAS domain S-box-containing protein
MLAEDRKNVLKEILRQLHAGANPQEVKEKFKQFLEGISPLEISRIEQELIREGMPREEIQRLCDVHMAVFREQLEKQKLDVPASHPINVLMEEHKIMLQLAGKLASTAQKIQHFSESSYVEEEIHVLQHLAGDFMDSEKHYLREENVLFPNLEKHGITEPPAIMWMEHNQIREKKKTLNKLIENYGTSSFQEFKAQLGELAENLNSLLANHFFKENNILFPTALRVITKDEWKAIRSEFDEIGYCCFTPPELTPPQIVKAEKEESVMPAQKETPFALQFETGTLTKEEIEALLNALPVDITFVDKDDTVRYFNKAEKRIFIRTKAVIGRKVQLCHPQKSIHIVNRILEAFKEGKRDVAEFWINVNNRLIHIRYFAVRDKNGKYLGTMEVTQDITDIKKIEGEKRLLDWKE